jgi:hypothetical protein
MKLQAEEWNGFQVVWLEGWAWNENYLQRVADAKYDECDSCIHCGRKTSNQKAGQGVLISEGGSALIREQDYETYTHGGGNMGWFPVGSECIKDIPTEFWVKEGK